MLFVAELRFVDYFFDAATRANESLSCRITPARQGRCRKRWLFLFRFTLSQKTSARVVVLSATLLSAAMLADPTVADVDEVCGFNHERGAGCRVSGAGQLS